MEPVDGLVLGPVLRRVVDDRATLWVQTAAPGTVEVRAGSAAGKTRTFTVYGHHYALIVVSGLDRDSVTPYEVLLDGAPVWPPAGSDMPPSVIRTTDPGDEVRLVFGSCREATSRTTGRALGPDALDAYARRLAAERRPVPDALLLLGDQVYADQLSPEVKEWLGSHERPEGAPDNEVVTYQEYAHLYLESWSDPEIRWLLSTVPTTMIFDDHEIADDWNSSASWRADAERLPWWPRRLADGLASYWVYQHLGNLHPDELPDDPAGLAMAIAEDHAYPWNYRLDLGRTRVIVLDNRGGRVLTPGRRAMLPTGQWEWLVAQTRGDYDHLVIGCSLPWLLAPALHHTEALMERLSDPRRGRVAVAVERLRRRFDLEHWAAVGRSFAALTALLADVGRDGRAPATITVLGGDVHHSYVAAADLGPGVTSAVHQITCSPMHNTAPVPIRVPMRVAWWRPVRTAAAAIARAGGVPRPAVRWRPLGGLYFGNAIGTLIYSGRSAQVVLEGTDAGGTLNRFLRATLSPLG